MGSLLFICDATYASISLYNDPFLLYIPPPPIHAQHSTDLINNSPMRLWDQKHNFLEPVLSSSFCVYDVYVNTTCIEMNMMWQLRQRQQQSSFKMSLVWKIYGPDYETCYE